MDIETSNRPSPTCNMQNYANGIPTLLGSLLDEIKTLDCVENIIYTDDDESRSLRGRSILLDTKKLADYMDSLKGSKVNQLDLTVYTLISFGMIRCGNMLEYKNLLYTNRFANCLNLKEFDIGPFLVESSTASPNQPAQASEEEEESLQSGIDQVAEGISQAGLADIDNSLKEPEFGNDQEESYELEEKEDEQIESVSSVQLEEEFSLTIGKNSRKSYRSFTDQEIFRSIEDELSETERTKDQCDPLDDMTSNSKRSSVPLQELAETRDEVLIAPGTAYIQAEEEITCSVEDKIASKLKQASDKWVGDIGQRTGVIKPFSVIKDLIPSSSKTKLQDLSTPTEKLKVLKGILDRIVDTKMISSALAGSDLGQMLVSIPTIYSEYDILCLLEHPYFREHMSLWIGIEYAASLSLLFTQTTAFKNTNDRLMSIERTQLEIRNLLIKPTIDYSNQQLATRTDIKRLESKLDRSTDAVDNALKIISCSNPLSQSNTPGISTFLSRASPTNAGSPKVGDSSSKPAKTSIPGSSIDLDDMFLV